MRGLMFVLFICAAIAIIYSGTGSSSSRETRQAPAPPPLTDEQIEAIRGGQWYGWTNVSPMTDFTNHFLMVETSATHRDRVGRSVRPGLTIRCRENVTAVILETSEYLGIDTLRVEYRMGEQPMRAAQWRISTDYTAAGLWSGGQAIPFVRQLLDGEIEQLAIRYTPYGESARTAIFNTDALDRRIGDLRETCGW